MKKIYLSFVFLMIGILTTFGQSAGWIFQPGSEGPWFEKEIEQGKPMEFYRSRWDQKRVCEATMLTRFND